LYRSPDGGLSLIPARPDEPGESKCNDRLGVFSSPDAALPSQHTVNRRHEERLQEMKHYPSIYRHVSIMNALQELPAHGPMTPPVQQGESSQSQSASQAHQHTSAESLVASNQDVEVSQDPRFSCPVCGKKLHSVGTVNRHFDDIHSAPKKCPYPDCNVMCIGKRKLHSHLDRHHKGVFPA
jgi:hypothetical protein